MPAPIQLPTETKMPDERQFFREITIETIPSIPTKTAGVGVLSSRRAARFFERAVRGSQQFGRVISSDFSREEAHSTGFLFVPVGLGLGAVLYFTASFEPSASVILAAMLVLAALQFLSIRQKSLQILVRALLIIMLGVACAKVQTWRNSTPMLSGEIATQITARVVTITPTVKSHRAVLDILDTVKPTLKFAPSRVRVTLRQGAEQLVAGDIITVRVRLAPPSGPIRRSSYDFAFQSYFDGIGANGFSIGPVTRATENKPAPRFNIALKLERLRQLIATKIRSVISGNEAEVAVALIAGMQAGIDDANMESLRITGLAHILSISGLHMALVAGVFIFTIRAGFSLSPNVAAKLPVKKYAALAALFASFFYLLLSGSDVAALRSFLMLAVFLVAILLDQKALTMRNVAIAAIFILIITPHEIMGPSFQMSFAATAALISAYAFWSTYNEDRPVYLTKSRTVMVLRKTGILIVSLAATSFIAGTATSLFSAWHFQRLAPLGLPANLAATPPISLIVMPSAIISAIAMPFGLEEWPLRIMGTGIKMMLAVSKYFVGISSDGVSGALRTSAFLMSCVSLVLVCLLQTRLKWLALIPVPVTLFLISYAKLPDVFISEDAKTVAVYTQDSALAVNRGRPNAFTLTAWQRAINTTKVTKPEAVDALTHAFACADDQCTMTLENGIVIGWVGYPKPPRRETKSRAITTVLSNSIPKSAESFLNTDRAAIEAILSAKFYAAADELCAKTDILVIEGPTLPNICAGSLTRVISAKDLALRGAAEIYFSSPLDQKRNKHLENNTATAHLTNSSKHPQNPTQPRLDKPAFEIRYAIGEPNRPWNYERKFSRAARNLPPFQAIPLPAP